MQALIRSHRLPPDDESETLENWPWLVKMYTLGRFAIELDGEPLSFTGKAKHRLLDVLKALVALGGQDVHQDRLIEAVWPDAEGDAGRRNFDTSLHRLRKLLDFADTLPLSEGRLSLNPARVWLDCRMFEHTAQAVQQALQSGTVVDTLQTQTERLLHYYQGSFCEGSAEEFWLLGPRQHWQDRFTALLADLAESYTAQNKPDLAIACYQAGLDRVPYAENLYKGLIQLYCSQAEPSKALAVHRQYVNSCHQAGLYPSSAIAALVEDL